MGYESKLIVGHRFQSSIVGNEACFLEIAELDLGKVCSQDFRTQSKVFCNPCDFHLIRGEEDVYEDNYGEQLHYAYVDDVIGALFRACDDYCMEYGCKPIIWVSVMKFLQSLQDSGDDSLVVVHFGH